MPMYVRLALRLVAVAGLVMPHAVGDGPTMTKLKDETFDNFLKKGPAFIYFRKGTSAEHEFQWQEFGKAYSSLRKRNVQVAYVDCDWRKVKKTCARFELASYPQLLFFHNPGDAEDYNTMSSTGKASASEITDYVEGIIDHSTSKADEMDDLDRELAELDDETPAAPKPPAAAQAVQEDDVSVSDEMDDLDRELAELDDKTPAAEAQREEERQIKSGNAPPKKARWAGLTKPTCVDYCYAKSCGEDMLSMRTSMLDNLLKKHDPLLTVKQHDWGEQQGRVICDKLEEQFPQDQGAGLPRVFMALEAEKRVVDGDAFVSTINADAYLPQFDGAKCASDDIVVTQADVEACSGQKNFGGDGTCASAASGAASGEATFESVAEESIGSPEDIETEEIDDQSEL